MSRKNIVASAFAFVAAVGFAFAAQALTSSAGGPERDAGRPLALRESPRNCASGGACERPAAGSADGIIDVIFAAPVFVFRLEVVGEANGALHLGGDASLLSWQTLAGLGSLDRAGANEILPIGIEDLGFSGAERLTVSFLASGAIDPHELQEEFKAALNSGRARLGSARRTY
jgi:hypothetical protein